MSENKSASTTPATSMSQRRMKTTQESKLWVAEIVGDAAHEGKRIDAGSILDIMDLLAGRIAYAHAECNVVTLSFDHVDLSVPILHNDLVRLEGQIIAVGSSSMIVRVTCFRYDTYSKEHICTHTSYITMVALDASNRPNKNIPGLIYDDNEQELKEQVVQRKKLMDEWLLTQNEVDNTAQLTVDAVEDPINREKRYYVTIPSTQIVVRRQFLPRHRNFGESIFGGDILIWMDRTATYCARNFSNNKNMITIAMNRVFFKQPIHVTDLVEMRARVVYVRNFIVVVEISVLVYKTAHAQSHTLSHTGFFTLLNFDENGFKRKILTGLQLSNDDQQSLKSYAKARAQYQFSQRHAAVEHSYDENTSIISHL